jgi:hypothetical protein
VASIRTEVLIRAPIAHVWDAVRDIGALHQRLVPGFVVDTRLEPGARVVTFGNGQVRRELILDIDDGERRLAWAIVDSPLRHYSASAQIFGAGSNACRFVWIADLLPDEMAGAVACMIEQGLAVARDTLERSAALV